MVENQTPHGPESEVHDIVGYPGKVATEEPTVESETSHGPEPKTHDNRDQPEEMLYGEREIKLFKRGLDLPEFGDRKVKGMCNFIKENLDDSNGNVIKCSEDLLAVYCDVLQAVKPENMTDFITRVALRSDNGENFFGYAETSEDCWLNTNFESLSENKDGTWEAKPSCGRNILGKLCLAFPLNLLFRKEESSLKKKKIAQDRDNLLTAEGLMLDEEKKILLRIREITDERKNTSPTALVQTEGDVEIERDQLISYIEKNLVEFDEVNTPSLQSAISAIFRILILQEKLLKKEGLLISVKKLFLRKNQDEIHEPLDMDREIIMEEELYEVRKKNIDTRNRNRMVLIPCSDGEKEVNSSLVKSARNLVNLLNMEGSDKLVPEDFITYTEPGSSHHGIHWKVLENELNRLRGKRENLHGLAAKRCTVSLQERVLFLLQNEEELDMRKELEKEHMEMLEKENDLEKSKKLESQVKRKESHKNYVKEQESLEEVIFEKCRAERNIGKIERLEKVQSEGIVRIVTKSEDISEGAFGAKERRRAMIKNLQDRSLSDDEVSLLCTSNQLSNIQDKLSNMKDKLSSMQNESLKTEKQQEKNLEASNSLVEMGAFEEIEDYVKRCLCPTEWNSPIL